jgi:hypothetical protein
MDMQMERIKGVLGNDCSRNSQNTLRFLKFLQRNVRASCRLTGIAEFDWERDYLADGWGGIEYEKMKSKRPSFMDQFELKALAAPDPGGDDIVACVKRVSDKKDFRIGLSLLEGIDFKDESFQYIEDYVAWYRYY